MDSIIFDVDGTLWDSTDSVARSWNLAIQENSSLDLTITENALQQVFGKTMTEIASMIYENENKRSAMSTLSQKLKKGTIRFSEVWQIADILGYDIKFEKKK